LKAPEGRSSSDEPTVELALALTIRDAAAAGRWALVAKLAEEIRARRLDRANGNGSSHLVGGVPPVTGRANCEG
jgi:hypothetical protein